MKNNVETRSNGVRIFKVQGKVIPLYYVKGSKNGPWDYLYNARTDADALATPNKDLICTRCKIEVETYSEIVYSQGSRICTNCKKETLEDDKRAFDGDMKLRCL